MIKLFTGKETISDILFTLPEANEILASHGLSCTSCHLNQYEVLDEGIKSHGYSDDDVARVLADLNEALQDSHHHKKVLLPPTITDHALDKIKELKHQQCPAGGLKIEAEVIEGEKDYFLDFLEQPETDDKIFHLETIQLFMEPLSDKTLFPFCEKPLLIHLLENAQQGGLENFIIVCNKENKSSIEDVLQTYSFSATTTIQPNLSDGMGGGVLAGLELIDPEEEVFILGGNDYIEPEAYQDVLNAGKKYDGALLGQKVDTYFPGGYINIDSQNIIQSIIEKPGEGSEPSNLVNIVIHYFKKAENIVSALQKAENKNDDWYEQGLDILFEEKQIQAVEYTQTWQAIKYPWHILDMQQVFLQQQIESKKFKNKDQYTQPKPNICVHETATIADTARLRGEYIYIESGVQINDNAVIQGPCYIGQDTIIGNNVLVRDSHIGSQSIIGFNTEIARSYLGNNVTTHSAYIGDSVVENYVNFGAFSTTANLRLDQKSIQVKIKDQRIDSKKSKLGAIIGSGTQIGIHACLMPGVKISPNTLISPSSTVK